MTNQITETDKNRRKYTLCTLLNDPAFSNKQIADFLGVSDAAIWSARKQYETNKTVPAVGLQAKAQKNQRKKSKATVAKPPYRAGTIMTKEHMEAGNPLFTDAAELHAKLKAYNKSLPKRSWKTAWLTKQIVPQWLQRALQTR